MRTEKQTLRTTVYVYAQAKSKYAIDMLKPGELPYEYRVKDFDYGDESSVRIMEHEILIPIPDGIDITTKCIENLREKIIAVEKEAKKQVKDLEERIRNLALIEYQPESPSDFDQQVRYDDRGDNI